MTFKQWNGEKLGKIFAIDTETVDIVDGVVSDFVIGSAHCPETGTWLFDLDTVDEFVRTNITDETTLVMHNAPYDFEVLSKQCPFIRQTLIDAVDNDRLFDTGIIHRLLELASHGKVGLWSLDHIVRTLFRQNMNKSSEVRMAWTTDMRINTLTQDRLCYAADDARMTWRVFETLFPKIKKKKRYLTHDIQLKGAIALNHAGSINGIGFDLGKKQAFIDAMQETISDCLEIMVSNNYIPKKKKSQEYPGTSDVLQHILARESKRLGRSLARMDSDASYKRAGKLGFQPYSTAADDIKGLREESEFIDALLTYKEMTKQIDFVKKIDSNRVFPYYTSIKNTGRTSCSRPNIQNPPRKQGVRECYVPLPGYVLTACDYSTLELCTLAQVCYQMYGESKMRDLINDGRDLHRYYCSFVYEKPESEVTKNERGLGKACFHPDTELLTPSGWRKIDNVRNSGDLVAQWDDGVVSFVRPMEWVSREAGDILDIHCGVHMSVTPDHRIPVLTRKGNLYDKTGLDISSKLSHCNVIQAGHMKYETSVSDIHTRIAVAVQADGTFRLPGRKCRCSFKKERKAVRLRYLLNLADIQYTETFNNDRYHFHFNKSLVPLGDDKEFLHPMSYDPDAFLDELFYWDGSQCTENETTRSYRTSDVDCVNTVQFICCVNNRRTTVTTQRSGYSNCVIYNVRISNSALHRVSRKTTVTRSRNRSVCCSVPSSYLVTRFDNSVVISGNCNFGLSGALGAATFVEFAKATYGVDITIDRARDLISLWKKTFPEMEKYLSDPLNGVYDWSFGPYDNPQINKAVAMKILGGATHSNAGKPYRSDVIQWVKDTVAPALHVGGKPFCQETRDQASRSKVTTLTGRERASTTFCAGKNTPFQGLAADGAKLALWECYKAGLKIVAFIHDEIIIESKIETYQEEAKLLNSLMVSAMQQVVPDVRISCEWESATHWSKGSGSYYRGDNLLVWDGNCDRGSYFIDYDKQERILVGKKCSSELEVVPL